MNTKINILIELIEKQIIEQELKVQAAEAAVYAAKDRIEQAIHANQSRKLKNMIECDRNLIATLHSMKA